MTKKKVTIKASLAAVKKHQLHFKIFNFSPLPVLFIEKTTLISIWKEKFNCCFLILSNSLYCFKV